MAGNQSSIILKSPDLNLINVLSKSLRRFPTNMAAFLKVFLGGPVHSDGLANLKRRLLQRPQEYKYIDPPERRIIIRLCGHGNVM